jgi:hypothetical protein
MSNFLSFSDAGFAAAVAAVTGVNVTAIQSFVQNWTTFYSGVGSGAHPGLTVDQAARGAAFGDSIGVALINPTSANLQTVVSTNSALNNFSPNTVSGIVANALIDVAEGKYTTSSTLKFLPPHQLLQGEAAETPGGGTINLTTGVDTVNLTQSNSTVNGTFGGVGATWTPGDTITAAGTTINETFNIAGIGTAGVINVTSVPGNMVSGVQNVNITASTRAGAVSDQAVIGDFTAAGPEGAWTGLLQLTVQSASSATAADNLTVGPAVAVQVTDTVISAPPSLPLATGPFLTVNGGSTVTINENNLPSNLPGCPGLC